MNLRIAELRWLSRQYEPVWGGHLERGQPISDPQIRAWLNEGIIKAVDSPVKGYVITDKGRRLCGDRQS